jgi:Protein of unknown function (DUF4013)
MRYLLAFQFFLFKPKRGLWNAIQVGIALIVPVAGQMVVMGYRSLVIEDLDDDPDKRYHRDFELNKLGDYLTRGLWQGLIQFAAQFLLIGTMYATMIGVAVSGGLLGSTTGMIILGVVGTVVMFVLAIALAMFLWPVEIYAALRPPFDFKKAVAFSRTFVAAMWQECLAAIAAFTVLSMVFAMLLWVVVVLISGIIGLLLGYGVDPAVGFVVFMTMYMIFWIIGIIVLQAVFTMANGHILEQLYGVYVEKGGEPLRDRDPFERDPMLANDNPE